MKTQQIHDSFWSMHLVTRPHWHDLWQRDGVLFAYKQKVTQETEWPYPRQSATGILSFFFT